MCWAVSTAGNSEHCGIDDTGYEIGESRTTAIGRMILTAVPCRSLHDLGMTTYIDEECIYRDKSRQQGKKSVGTYALRR